MLWLHVFLLVLHVIEVVRTSRQTDGLRGLGEAIISLLLAGDTLLPEWVFFILAILVGGAALRNLRAN